MAYVYPPNTRYLELYEEVEEEEKENKIGIWLIEDFFTPRGFNQKAVE